MPERACLDCGRSFKPKTQQQRRCDRHQGSGTGYSHNRDRAAQARFRAAVLERDGRRCTYERDGRRCAATEDLRACHLIPLVEGGSYDLENGTTLCRQHDRESDSHAR